MLAMLSVLKKVGMNVLWAFLGEKVMGKLIWYTLEYAAKKTSNKIDDEAVAEAKKVYYGGRD